MLKIIATCVAGMAILASGYVHGVWTERWTRGEEALELAAQLPELPLRIGDWEGEDTQQQASSIDRQLTGSLQRRYTHAATGQSVTVLLLCGRPGPICIHTPDVCYGASGYDVGKKVTSEIPGGAGKLWMADAVRNRTTETNRLRIFWGWSQTGEWQAVTDPRATFAGRPALIKMYVLRDLASENEKLDNDICLQFLQEFVPLAKSVLFSSADSE